MTIGRIASGALVALLVLVPGRAHARVVGPAQQIVAAARIAAVADRIARDEVRDADRALAPAFALSDISVPAGSVVIVAGLPQLNATYVSVPIRIEIDGRLARTIFAGYRITTFVRTAVAAHDLAPDTILNASDLIAARVPFTGRPGLETTTFVGRKVRALTPRGSILYPELTSVNEIVRAGMPALFVVHDGPVALAADVVARTSGGIGQSVTIYDPQTGKALSGIVTGPNRVELTLPGANE